MAAHFLLWAQMVYKVYEFNSHVWVSYFAVENYGDAACELHVEVDILSKVCLWVYLMEELWETV